MFFKKELVNKYLYNMKYYIFQIPKYQVEYFEKDFQIFGILKKISTLQKIYKYIAINYPILTFI